MRCVLLPFVWMDHAAHALVERMGLGSAALLDGECTRGGHCCRHVLVPAPPRTGPLRTLVLAWFTEVHGFFRRGFDVELPGGGGHAWVMGCRYLRADGACAHHVLRPLVCRRYPFRVGLPPHLLPGCGYRLKNPALKVLS